MQTVWEQAGTGLISGVILRSGLLLAATKDLLFGPAPFMRPVLVQLAQELGAECSAGLLKQDLKAEQAMLNKLQNPAARVWSTNLGIKERPEGGIRRKAA
jgi:hypothetical protein